MHNEALIERQLSKKTLQELRSPTMHMPMYVSLCAGSRDWSVLQQRRIMVLEWERVLGAVLPEWVLQQHRRHSASMPMLATLARNMAPPRTAGKSKSNSLVWEVSRIRSPNREMEPNSLVPWFAAFRCFRWCCIFATKSYFGVVSSLLAAVSLIYNSPTQYCF